MAGKLFVISAPSGTGKTTVVNAVIEHLHPFPLKKVITYTSRSARIGEIHGIDYHFVSESEFLSLQEKGFFIATSNCYKAFYGVQASVVKDLKESVSYFIILDWLGAQEIKKYIPHAILIWLFPPSLTLLKERLIKRSTETEEDIDHRLKQALWEIEQEKTKSIFQYQIMNHTLDQTIDLMKEIVLKECSILT